MKIGIIGTGHIGSTLAHLWVEAGHEVILSSRHPEQLQAFAKELGPKASVGTPEQAAREGEAVLLSIPLRGVKELSDEIRGALRGKVVMDTCNPYPERDGDAAQEVFRGGQGAGVWTSKQIPGARVVRAFNSVRYTLLRSEAHRPGDPIGIPIASDDAEALRVAAQLARDAGLGPVVAGPLQRAKDFDVGTPPYASGASAGELERMLGARKKAA